MSLFTSVLGIAAGLVVLLMLLMLIPTKWLENIRDRLQSDFDKNTLIIRNFDKMWQRKK